MSSKIKILLVLLTIQLLFLSIQFFKGNSEDQIISNSRSKFILFSREIYNEIEIKTQDEKLILKKSDGKWKLDNFYSFPANQQKVDDFISGLSDIDISYPVGKTQIAAKQFRTDEENFERRISFLSDGKPIKTIYLGASPSFKYVYGRLEGENQTYSIKYGSYEASSKATDWIDTQIYTFDESEIQEIIAPGFSLIHEVEGFTIKSLPEASSVKNDEVQKTVAKFLRIPFKEVLGDQIKDETGFKKVVFNFQLKNKSGQNIAYNFTGPIQKDGDFILKVSNWPYYFLVDRNRVNDLRTLALEDLIDMIEENEGVN